MKTYKKLRKCFAISLLMVVGGLTVNAQQGHGSFVSLNVDYYNHGSKTGHLIFHNNSGSTISKAHVKVSVHITETDTVVIGSYAVPTKKNKILILCDDDFYNIPKGESKQTSSSRGVVKGGPEKNGKTYRYEVEVDYQSPFPGGGSGSNSSSNGNYSDDGERIMSGEVLHAMMKSLDDPAPSRITVDVYRTKDGKYYARMTYPESIEKLEIFKLKGSTYNGYVRYANNNYGILINDGRW